MHQGKRNPLWLRVLSIGVFALSGFLVVYFIATGVLTGPNAIAALAMPVAVFSFLRQFMGNWER